MKINGMIKCPHCGGSDIHVYQFVEPTIWDDEFHAMLNNEYPKDKKLNCDTITYKAKCDDENCEKYFMARLKLKCEIEDVITVKEQSELYDNYFKK